jgi:diguanylate cyclase (GGDEF)-like protein
MIMREQASNILSALFDGVDRISHPDTLTKQQQDDLQNIKSLAEDLFNYFLRVESELNIFKQSAQIQPEGDEEEVYTLLALIFARLRQSIDINDLLDNVTLEIFEVLQSNQVIFCKFADQSLQDLQIIEHESVNEPARSLLGKAIPEIYTDPEWLKKYQSCISQIIDINGNDAAKSLQILGVRSAIAVAIPSDKKIWGLLIVHQYGDVHNWQDWEIELLEKLGTQLAITIHQMQLLDKSENAKIERDQVIAQLHHNQLHDPLTDLPNRESFMESLNLAFGRLKADANRDFAVLFIDCDRFKSINDNFSTAIGDRLLQEISKRISDCVSSESVIARIDSDEFAVLVENINNKIIPKEKFIVDLTNQILESIKQPFSIDTYKISTSVSIGIAFSNLEFNYASEILRDANTAMNHSRNFGRGKQIIFKNSMSQETKVKWQLESDLRQAIASDQFYLVYQPIVSLHVHKLTGFEVLIRWLHPTQGLISPQEFLPIAEESGGIIEIGYWVLETACKQLHQWQLEFSDMPSITIGINVSTLQVVQSNFVERIQDIIARNHILPSLIKLEITETMLMNNIEVSAQKLEELRKIGIQVYIDDFGTGYSSFSYLQNLPVDVLKIDRSFTNRVSTDIKSQRIIQSILRLANNLGMKIVVEGVETSQEIDYFEGLGDQSIELQGFFISHPLDKDKATEWIRSHS